MGKTFKASVDWLGMVENPNQDVNPSVSAEMAQGGQLKKFQKKGQVNEPLFGTQEQIDSYADSLNLYNAYKFQINNSEKEDSDYEQVFDIYKGSKSKTNNFYKSIKHDTKEAFNSYDEYKKASADFDNFVEKYPDNWDKLIKEEPYKSKYEWTKSAAAFKNTDDFKKLKISGDYNKIKYYESLKFSNPNDVVIGRYSSADIGHRKIKPVDSYWGGKGYNPIYKKPVQPYILDTRDKLEIQKLPIKTSPLPVDDLPTEIIYPTREYTPPPPPPTKLEQMQDWMKNIDLGDWSINTKASDGSAGTSFNPDLYNHYRNQRKAFSKGNPFDFINPAVIGAYPSNQNGRRGRFLGLFDEGAEIKLSVGADSSHNCGPGLKKCGDTEGPVTLQRYTGLNYNPGNKNVGMDLDLGTQFSFGPYDTRSGAPVLQMGLSGSGSINPKVFKNPEVENAFNYGVDAYGKLGYKKRSLSSSAKRTNNPGFEAGVYGNYDLLNKNINDVGIYGGYGGFNANLGYNPLTKGINAGIGYKFQPGGDLLKAQDGNGEYKSKDITKEGFDWGGYFSGEQGWIPDYDGVPTLQMFDEQPVKQPVKQQVVEKVKEEQSFTITPQLLYKQAFVESKLEPKAKNRDGYKGLGQIGDALISDYLKANKIDKIDPFDPKQNYDVQSWSMNELYNSSFIDKPGSTDEVKLAKALAAYNWGRGNMLKFLTNQKEKGVDIYKSTDWLSDLPKETREYIDMIMYNGKTKGRPNVQENFLNATTADSLKYLRTLYGYKQGGSLPKAQFGQNISKLYNKTKDAISEDLDYVERIANTLPQYLNPKTYNYSKEKGVDSIPNYNKYNSFGEAFKQAREDLGRGQTFLYNGKRYTTTKENEFPSDESERVFNTMIKTLSPEQKNKAKEHYFKQGAPYLSLEADDTKFNILPNAQVSFSDLSNRSNRAHVNPVGPYNKVYLETRDYFYDHDPSLLVEELAHIEQARDKGTGPFLKHLFFDAAKGALQNKSPYDTKGAIEYDAHEVIGPKRLKEIMGYQNGGSLPKAQEGKQFNTLEADLISKVLMNRNRDKDFVQRAYALGQNPNMFSVPDPDQFGSNMSHKMAWGEDEFGQAYMYPTVMNPGNESIKVPNQYADYISSEGYKKATGMKKYGGQLPKAQEGYEPWNKDNETREEYNARIRENYKIKKKEYDAQMIIYNKELEQYNIDKANYPGLLDQYNIDLNTYNNHEAAYNTQLKINELQLAQVERNKIYNQNSHLYEEAPRPPFLLSYGKGNPGITTDPYGFPIREVLKDEYLNAQGLGLSGKQGVDINPEFFHLDKYSEEHDKPVYNTYMLPKDRALSYEQYLKNNERYIKNINKDPEGTIYYQTDYRINPDDEIKNDAFRTFRLDHLEHEMNTLDKVFLLAKQNKELGIYPDAWSRENQLTAGLSDDETYPWDTAYISNYEKNQNPQYIEDFTNALRRPEPTSPFDPTNPIQPILEKFPYSSLVYKDPNIFQKIKKNINLGDWAINSQNSDGSARNLFNPKLYNHYRNQRKAFSKGNPFDFINPAVIGAYPSNQNGRRGRFLGLFDEGGSLPKFQSTGQLMFDENFYNNTNNTQQSDRTGNNSSYELENKKLKNKHQEEEAVFTDINKVLRWQRQGLYAPDETFIDPQSGREVPANIGSMSSWDFEDKYGTSLHAMRNTYDKAYVDYMSSPERQKAISKFGTIKSELQNNLDNAGYNPNSQWMIGASNQQYGTPEQKANTAAFHNNVIGAVVPIPGLQALKLTNALKLPGLIDDAVLPAISKVFKGQGTLKKLDDVGNINLSTPYYHGSPWRWKDDLFDASMIGKGEGATKRMQGLNLFPEEKLHVAPKFANIKNADAPLHIGSSNKIEQSLLDELNPTIYKFDDIGNNLKLKEVSGIQIKNLKQKDLIKEGFDGIRTQGQITVFPSSVNKLTKSSAQSIEEFVKANPNVKNWVKWTTNPKEFERITGLKLTAKELEELKEATKQLPGSGNVDKIMSLEAPKGNMYGQNQVLTQQQRLLNPDIKNKFFEHQAPVSGPKENMFQKMFKDYNNRITPENYDDFVKNIHGSTDYNLAKTAGKQPHNLGIGNYGKPGMVYSDAPLNNLGKDIINAHEKNHGMFAGTLSKEMSDDLLKPFGTNKPIPHYALKHQADEVFGRMGQFKNAVGIGDNQTFTLGHLNLIRKNYAKSFLDNDITEMLKKIKPGSAGEKEFLTNMNKYAFGLAPAAIIGAASQMGPKQEDGQFKYGGQNNFGLDLKTKEYVNMKTGKEIKSDDIYSTDKYSKSAKKYKRTLVN